jgi:hypothetical protein
VLTAISAGAGATLSEITALSGWLPHTARAAVTGLRQRGFPVQLHRARGAQSLPPADRRLRVAAMAKRRGAGSGLPRMHHAANSTGESHVNAVELREAWQRLHRAAAPAALSPDMLRRDIAYRQQADWHGGLSADARRRLAALAGADASQASQPRPQTARIKPGSTLLREWHGRTYTVLALEEGFETSGQRFASLSEVARHITGAHWSGPRFFGLRREGAAASPRLAQTSAVHA